MHLFLQNTCDGCLSILLITSWLNKFLKTKFWRSYSCFLISSLVTALVVKICYLFLDLVPKACKACKVLQKLRQTELLIKSQFCAENFNQRLKQTKLLMKNQFHVWIFNQSKKCLTTVEMSMKWSKKNNDLPLKLDLW